MDLQDLQPPLNGFAADGNFTGFDGHDTSASPWKLLLTVHDNDVDVFSPFRLPLVVAAAKAKIVMLLIVTLPMLACTLTHRVTMMKTARWTPSKQSLATGYDNDGVGFSAGVGVSSVVGVNSQGVSPDVGLVASLVVASLSSTLREPV